MYFQEIPRRNISIFNCYAIENLIDGKPKSNNPKYVSLLTNRNILFTKKFALLIFSLTKYINRSTICRTHRRTSMKITKQTHKKWKKQKTDITNWAIKTNQFHIFFLFAYKADLNRTFKLNMVEWNDARPILSFIVQMNKKETFH